MSKTPKWKFESVAFAVYPDNDGKYIVGMDTGKLIVIDAKKALIPPAVYTSPNFGSCEFRPGSLWKLLK